MSEKPKNRRPVAATKSHEYVSHSVKIKGDDRYDAEQSPDTPMLTSANHAFYVGKIIPRLFREGIKNLLGWGSSQERIYNSEFLAGALDYLFADIKEGHRARVVVCRSLSELFNGSEDVEDALTTEQEIILIKKIAKKKFKKEDLLEVMDLEEQPQHKALFEALRSSVDSETGLVNIEKALSDDNGQSVVAENDSLQIAKMLFRANQESEELSKAFKKAIPARLKDSAEDNPTAQYYPLIEVAIRLADNLHGMHIQGGSERQAIYNGIIIQLIKGEGGRYKDVEELKHLFEVLQGLRFETLHLSNEKNEHRIKRMKNLFRWRMAIYTTLFLSVLSAGVVIGQWHEKNKQKRRQDEVNEILKTELKDLIFYLDRFEIGKEHNVKIFNELVRKILDDLRIRYQMPDEICEELKPFVQKYLLDNKLLLGSMYRSNSTRIDRSDLFVRMHDIYFKNKGVDAGKPYGHLYRYVSMLKALLESDENLSFNTESIDPVHPTGKKEVEYVGTFISGRDYGNKYEFYLYKADDREYLVARNRNKERYQTNDRHYTSKRAKEGAAAFLQMISRYDALPLNDLNSQIHRMTYWSEDDKDREYCEQRSVSQRTATLLSSPITYRDTFGRFEYSVIEDNGYDRKREESVDCLLAKKPKDKVFNHSRMTEVVRRYGKARGWRK